MRDPIEIVAVLFQHLAVGRWHDAARLVDEEDLGLWYRGFAEAPSREGRLVTAAEVKRHDSNMPDAVAEYQAERINQSRGDEGGHYSILFATLKNRADLRRVEPVEAFADWLHAHDFDVQMRRHCEMVYSEHSHHKLPAHLERRREVVGAVPDGRCVHVVYRISPPGADEISDQDEANVVTLINRDGKWRVRLRGQWWVNEGGVVAFGYAELEEGEVDPS